MPPNQQAELLLAQTRTMLTHAEAGEWEGMEALDSERLAVMEAVFGEPLGSSANIAALIDLLQQVWQLNDRLIQLAILERDALGVQLIRLRNENRAGQFYLDMQQDE